MLDFNLPVYVMRGYDEISTEGEFTVITTRYDRYILDQKNLPGNYAQRRLSLFSRRSKLPYKIYPLKKRVEYLSQLVGSGKKVFIDSNGRLIKWKPQTMYKIVTSKVLTCTRIFNGKYQCYLRGVPYPFVLSKPANYISYILFKGVPVIFGVYDEEPQPPRLRVKL